ncbi:MAG: hypothetical protein VX947_06905, partial [Chloroflexota bacterium]|nr:hypothetical protein [Chloroflexota bacterium]MEC9288374.1 hypothetical protein [Chloroflexota bacterium]
GVAVVCRTGVAVVGESEVIRDTVVDKAGGLGAVTGAGTRVTVVAGNGPGADATCVVCSVDSGDGVGVATGV